METYNNADELNFHWEKTALHFSQDLQFYNCNNNNSPHNLQSVKR